LRSTPAEILKTEFMEAMGVSSYARAKAIAFPGIYEVVRGDRAISADTAIRLGKYFALSAQFWLNLQNDYDLRIAEGSGIGKGIKPLKIPRDAAHTGAYINHLPMVSTTRKRARPLII
jgi:antitoxin HigA-1